MTLGFNWATNTNYSSGPDLGTPTKVDPSSAVNGFIPGVIAAPQHINYLVRRIADDLGKAIDGVDGGTYELQSDLVFDGPAAVHIAGEMEIDSGGSLTVFGLLAIRDAAELDSSAVLSVAGKVDIEDDGEINVKTGGLINLANGAKILGGVNAEVQLRDADDLTIDNSSFSFRLALRPASIEDVAGTPAYTPFIGRPLWVMHEVSAGRSISYPLGVRPGDVLTTLRMTLRGQVGVSGHSLVPENKPRLQLISLDLDGTITLIQEVTDPVGTPGGSATAYNSSHTVTLSGGALPLTLSGSALYFARVISESGTDAEADKTGVTAIDGTGLAKAYRGASEVYA